MLGCRVPPNVPSSFCGIDICNGVQSAFNFRAAIYWHCKCHVFFGFILLCQNCHRDSGLDWGNMFRLIPNPIHLWIGLIISTWVWFAGNSHGFKIDQFQVNSNSWVPSQVTWMVESYGFWALNVLISLFFNWGKLYEALGDVLHVFQKIKTTYFLKVQSFEDQWC